MIRRVVKEDEAITSLITDEVRLFYSVKDRIKGILLKVF